MAGACPSASGEAEKCATGKALGDQASTVVLSCGPPYLLGFTVTALNGAELYETTFIELAWGVFTIRYSASPSVPKAIAPSLRRRLDARGFAPRERPCGPARRTRV